MPAQKSFRNHRNNPYTLDRAAIAVHHSAAGTMWRFRTELATLASGTEATRLLAAAVSLSWALIIIGATVAVLMVVPWSRRIITRRAWCIMSRHRLQRLFFETHLHTRSGRLSLILRIHPTEVGERAVIWCRAGICFEDLEAHSDEIAAACYARAARVERSASRAQMVTVNIVRRDTLAPHHVIASSLPARATWPRDTGGTAA